MSTRANSRAADFDDPAHPEHHAFAQRHHKHHFEQVDPAKLAALLEQAGFASAQGTLTRFADRPARLIRATR